MNGHLKSGLVNTIYHKFAGEPWYGEVLSYLSQRYNFIEDRTMGSFRYVDCHPANRGTFSFEFASILRDAGSAFSSVTDKLVRHSRRVAASQILSMGDYVEWLKEMIPKLHLAAAELSFPLEERLLVPFKSLGEPDTTVGWWKAYNNVKHADIDMYQEGNLEHAVSSVAGLAVLCSVAGSLLVPVTMRLFRKVGLLSSGTKNEKLMFSK